MKFKAAVASLVMVIFVIMMASCSSTSGDQAKMQELEKKISALEAKVAVLEKNSATKTELGNLQKIFTEIADELALLNVKIAMVEDSLQK